MDESKIRCTGCGALVDNIEGQPHKYIGATQGCWNLYGEILAKEYGEYRYPELTHRLTVDTYSVQHPGQPSRQSIQAVNGHLFSLYLVLEKNLSGGDATKKLGDLLEKEPKFTWLEPPAPNGNRTVHDVLVATNLQEHEKLVREWAEDVWKCWYDKHAEQIESIYTEYV